MPPGVVGPRCGRCADDDWYFSAALPLHSYVGLARAVVLRLKRSKDRALVSAVARLYFESRKKELLAFKPDCTAIICGPPIMIKFVLQALIEMGFDKKQVYTTLELKMKCGIGKCGRCNIGSKFVCKDGPVFRCDEIDELPGEY